MAWSHHCDTMSIEQFLPLRFFSKTDTYIPSLIIITINKWNWKLIMQNKTLSTICLVFSFFWSDLRVSVKDSLLCLRRGQSRDVLAVRSRQSCAGQRPEQRLGHRYLYLLRLELTKNVQLRREQCEHYQWSEGWQPESRPWPGRRRHQWHAPAADGGRHQTSRHPHHRHDHPHCHPNRLLHTQHCDHHHPHQQPLPQNCF